MNTVETFTAMLASLREADDRLQVSLRNLAAGYYEFMYAPRRGGLKVQSRLVLRRELDGDGRIRRLFWAKRIRAKKTVGLRTIRLSTRLHGPFQSGWIYKLARDWARRERYYEFDQRRRLLVGLRQEAVKVQRALRMSLTLKWAPARARHAAGSGEASAGAEAFAREVSRVETEIGLFIEDFRRAFARHADVTFEPALRPNENGTWRLFWGFPQQVQTPEGPRTFTEYLPGRPTDRSMRALGLSAAVRKEVGSFLKRLRPLEDRHEELLEYLARHRRRVGELVARVEKITAAAPAAAVRNVVTSP